MKIKFNKVRKLFNTFESNSYNSILVLCYYKYQKESADKVTQIICYSLSAKTAASVKMKIR